MARQEQKNRSEKVRQAILDTALEMGMEEGFENVSIRKIISRMKYSTGVVYHHFKDKQEIMDAIEEGETKKLYGEIAQLLDDKKSGLANMETVFHRIMRLAYEEPEKYNLMVLLKYSRHKGGRPPWIASVSESLKQEIAGGNIRELDAEKAAFAIWSSFLGFNLMISRYKDLTEAEAEELFKVQFEMIIKGIKKV